MNLQTPVDIPLPDFRIEPLEPILFVGSCFADSIGQRFAANRFPVTVNPYGTMYNPVSVLHTIERQAESPCPRIVFITLGTNHIYRLRETGEVVDNCQKRPQRLFLEEELSVAQCALYLRRCIAILRSRRPDVRVIFTVSPIRYRKYGFHESQLSKATLLLAADQVVSETLAAYYFPAYELVLDELRDYRFYQPDMIHPSDQTADYIFDCLTKRYFSDSARQFLAEWQPIKAAFAHRPFNPDSDAYCAFIDSIRQKEEALIKKYTS